MKTTARRLALMTGCSFLLVAASWAQTSSIEGEVKGEDGNPLKGALVRIEREDIKGNYRVKTNNRGHYFHAGLPLGTYKISLEVGGKVLDQVQGVRTSLGEATRVNFDLQQTRRRQEALRQAAQAGELTEEQRSSLTREQREAIEKQMQAQAQAMKKNKALNDAFNVAMAAKQAQQWDVAVENFEKAGEIDPEQHVIWANLAESYIGLAEGKRGTEQEAALVKGLESYEKVLVMQPDDAAYHNNYALALARAKRFDEAQAELEKAAEINPAGGGQYFYNLGAVLVNIGQMEPAGTAFLKAIEMDPRYAPAQYQYGLYLVSKATTSPDGRIVPPAGTKEAFQKYLELEPNGQFAASATGMLASLEGTVETEYVDPAAAKGRKKQE